MHTYTEAATVLGLTNHRKWRKCLTVAGLLPTISAGDKRRKLLTDDDLDALRRTRDTLWPPTSHSAGQQHALPVHGEGVSLAARMATLERRIAALEAQMVRRVATPPAPDPRAPPPSLPSDVPDGAQQLGPFATLAGIPETTLRRWVERGEVEAVNRPSAKPGQTERWVTPTGQQQARERAAARRGA